MTAMEGVNGVTPPAEELPEEAVFLEERRVGNLIAAARALLSMNVHLPTTEDGQFLVTGRDGLQYLRTYTSARRLEAAGHDAAHTATWDFHEMLDDWKPDDIGVVVNPEDDSEFRIPPNAILEILALTPREEPEPEPTPLVPVDPPKEVLGFRFAAIVDGVSDDGEPVLSPSRARVDDQDERQRISGYLDSGEVIQYVNGFASDMFEPERGLVAPMHTFTDGRWVWSADMAYYLSTYGIAPEPDFLDAIVKSGYQAP
ncbi:MAG: hypothetical protein GEU94_08820, partial [Micromonosporaceae bacterium]|nr:hypothetical protein [Micromonosporaceae bacterium]